MDKGRLQNHKGVGCQVKFDPYKKEQGRKSFNHAKRGAQMVLSFLKERGKCSHRSKGGTRKVLPTISPLCSPPPLLINDRSLRGIDTEWWWWGGRGGGGE